jgi:hypothetical protein
MVREILRFCDSAVVNVSDANGETALFHAIRANNIEICRDLLSAGAAVAINHKSRDMYVSNSPRPFYLSLHDGLLIKIFFCRETALFLAVRERNNNIVHLLMEYGADITSRNNDGKLPLELVDSVLSASRLNTSAIQTSGNQVTVTGINKPMLPAIMTQFPGVLQKPNADLSKKCKKAAEYEKDDRTHLVSSLSVDDWEMVPWPQADIPLLPTSRPTSPGPMLPTLTLLPGSNASSSSSLSLKKAPSGEKTKHDAVASATPQPQPSTQQTSSPVPSSSSSTTPLPRRPNTVGSGGAGRRAKPLTESAIASIAVQTGEVTPGNPELYDDGGVTPGNPALEGNTPYPHFTEEEVQVRLKEVQFEYQERERAVTDKLMKAEGEVDTLKGMVSALTAEVAILRRRLGEPIH